MVNEVVAVRISKHLKQLYSKEILSNVVDGCERIRADYAAGLSSPSWNLPPSMTRGMSL